MLIKQKQTQAWKTTKATADAVYSILLGGDNLLASTKLVDVSLTAKRSNPKTSRLAPDLSAKIWWQRD